MPASPQTLDFTRMLGFDLLMQSCPDRFAGESRGVWQPATAERVFLRLSAGGGGGGEVPKPSASLPGVAAPTWFERAFSRMGAPIDGGEVPGQCSVDAGDTAAGC